jgi:hypothetical protein
MPEQGGGMTLDGKVACAESAIEHLDHLHSVFIGNLRARAATAQYGRLSFSTDDDSTAHVSLETLGQAVEMLRQIITDEGGNVIANEYGFAVDVPARRLIVYRLYLTADGELLKQAINGERACDLGNRNLARVMTVHVADALLQSATMKPLPETLPRRDGQ